MQTITFPCDLYFLRAVSRQPKIHKFSSCDVRVRAGISDPGYNALYPRKLSG